MKNIPGENIRHITSYLKGIILLLNNYNSLPTDLFGLLNDTMIADDSKVFSAYMQSIYFSHKIHIKDIIRRKYVEFTEKEYRMLYREKTWSTVKIDPDSSFYVGDSEKGNERGKDIF